MTESSEHVFEEGAELSEDEAERVDVGDVGEEPEEVDHDDVRDQGSLDSEGGDE